MAKKSSKTSRSAAKTSQSAPQANQEPEQGFFPEEGQQGTLALEAPVQQEEKSPPLPLEQSGSAQETEADLEGSARFVSPNGRPPLLPSQMSVQIMPSAEVSDSEMRLRSSSDVPPPDMENKRGEKGSGTWGENLQRSPDLFPDGRTVTRMASALPLWEAGNILTQGQDLPWNDDLHGKLRYAQTVENGEGAVHFWVTENLEDEAPSALAGAAALAMIDTFDIRAACMHLIYAAHATQLERPWEQEFIIDDRQIEEYLGLKTRTDKNKQQKLALIQEIATQPCKITTYVSWPTQSKVKGFTLEEGRLWHLLGTRYHYEQDLFGNKELVSITFIVRAGLWARYFLNEEGSRNRTALCEYATLSKTSLRDVMGVWQHRESAARLMVWLLFKTRSHQRISFSVCTLMEVAFGRERVEQSRSDSQHRKRLVSLWDDTLLLLHERGWNVQFDAQSYPIYLRPVRLRGRQGGVNRPRGFFKELLKAVLWIKPHENWSEAAIAIEDEMVKAAADMEMSLLTGESLRSQRMSRGWSQRKLSALTGLSQGLISQLENGGRTITPENQEILERIFDLNTDLSVSSS